MLCISYVCIIVFFKFARNYIFCLVKNYLLKLHYIFYFPHRKIHERLSSTRVWISFLICLFLYCFLLHVVAVVWLDLMCTSCFLNFLKYSSPPNGMGQSNIPSHIHETGLPSNQKSTEINLNSSSSYQIPIICYHLYIFVTVFV